MKWIFILKWSSRTTLLCKTTLSWTSLRRTTDTRRRSPQLVRAQLSFLSGEKKVLESVLRFDFSWRRTLKRECNAVVGGGEKPRVFVLLEETSHHFSVWTTHPSWMNSSKAAHSDTNWGHWHCRATKDRMGNRSSAPLRDESRKLWGFITEENTSKHLSVNRVTFTKFDGPFFPGDWKESKSIGAPNGCVFREIFWEGEFLPGDDGRPIAFSLCADSERLFIGAHTQG